MTFYLKYRSQDLEQLDLKNVRETLTKIVKSGNIPHAFLFSGPKGTGKTSAARILAKIINCENRKKRETKPCNKCFQCKSIIKGSNIDVIELDAASHRGIDDVRALRDAVKLTPASSKKKVYIIDEAHMLTTEASNALLKTLEEPPEHVVFILATTDWQKLIETIRSRVVTVSFKKASEEEILRSLERIKKGEKLKIKTEGLRIIAKHSEGSFRDAIKLLEQIALEVKVLSEENIEKFIDKGASFMKEDFFGFLKKKETKEALLWIDKRIEKGVSAAGLCKIILDELRDSLRSIYGIGQGSLDFFNKDELIELVRLFDRASSDIPGPVIEHLPLELAVIDWCGNNPDDKGEEKEKKEKENKSENVIKSETDNPVKFSGCSVDGDVWMRILRQIRPNNSTTEALLRAARPIDFSKNILTLGVFYNFHKEKLENNQHKRLIEDIAGEILGEKITVICQLAKPPDNGEKLDDKTGPLEEKGKDRNVLTEGDDEDIIRVAKEIFGE